MKRLSKVVVLPQKVLESAEPGPVRTYVRDLHNTLEFVLKDTMRRADGALPRDGSEEMESDLTLANNTPTVDEHAASKKYVDDLVAAVVTGLPSGTRLYFDQDAAPTGWTRDATINDRVIRIVSGARADGGSWTLGGLDVTGATDAYTLLEADMPAHVHGVTDPGHVHGGVVKGGASFQLSSTESNTHTDGSTASAGTGISILSKGGGGGHAHGLGAAGISSDGTWRPLHRDSIVAVKD